MARLPEREVIRLKKQVAVMRGDVNRALFAADLGRVNLALSKVSRKVEIAAKVAPFAAIAGPLLLRRASIKLPTKRLIVGALLGWRLFRGARSISA